MSQQRRKEKEKRLDFTDDPGNKLLAVPEVGSIPSENSKIKS